MYNILSIEEIDNDIGLWGGKAVGLSMLKKRGYRVPKGMVISSEVYKSYQENTLNKAAFDRLLEKVLHIHLDKKGNTIFRSSANIEGIDDTCCCGVFSSYVYSPKQKPIDVVAQVWGSAISNESLSYYKLMNIDMELVRMAVIIQEVKIGIISGTIHTYDLVADKKRIIIEYEYGNLGAVVDGEKDAERLVFDNDELIYGTLPKDILPDRISKLLSDSHSIEKLFSAPLEIEFQICEDDIYYVQARKLT